MRKGDRALKRNSNRIAMNAHNRAANYMNTGGVDTFNKSQERKYGKNFYKRDGYAGDYQKAFSKKYDSYLQEETKNFRKTNRNYKKYDMGNWDDKAKANRKYF